jgi:hypothetical protein|tara:strand:- start:1139 stop:1390 length:252 start_codon:yes stop_codon:yes gene_type:complete
MSDLKNLWKKYEFEETDYIDKIYLISSTDEGSSVFDVGIAENGKIMIDVIYSDEEKIIDSLTEYEVDPSNAFLGQVNDSIWKE